MLRGNPTALNQTLRIWTDPPLPGNPAPSARGPNQALDAVIQRALASSSTTLEQPAVTEELWWTEPTIPVRPVRPARAVRPRVEPPTPPVRDEIPRHKGGRLVLVGIGIAAGLLAVRFLTAMPDDPDARPEVATVAAPVLVTNAAPAAAAISPGAIPDLPPARAEATPPQRSATRTVAAAPPAVPVPVTGAASPGPQASPVRPGALAAGRPAARRDLVWSDAQQKLVSTDVTDPIR